MKHDHSSTQYKENSLSLTGAVSMGTAVIIGAGIFALTGQIAELAGPWFPIAFLVAAVITAFSAYSYVKLSNAFPSAGGIAMFLEKAYGKGTITAAGALLMYFSMVINESLVARTFGSYTLQLFDIGDESWLVPALGVGLLIFAFLINVSGNRMIGTFSFVMSVLKIGGIAAFGVVGLWLSGFSLESFAAVPAEPQGASGFLAAVALAILAYKGFTTITNSGSEIVDPHRNVGRAIILSIVICVVVYFLVAMAVAGNLTLPEIIAAKNFALAEAARPAFGDFGLWFTVVLAIIATVSGVGHPVKSLAAVRCVDTRSAQICGPDGISQCFQVSSDSREPVTAKVARSLLSKDSCRAVLGDKVAPDGPEVSLVAGSSAFPCD